MTRMQARAVKPSGLIERLPPVRGRLTPDAPLAPITWFGVGGPAEVLFRPADAEDLAAFLAARPADVPVTVIGVGSNLLVRDGGVPGVVVRAGGGLARIEVLEGHRIHCGGAALDVNVARTALQAGLTGLEFLIGVPGTIGGAVRMNAGAFGRETADVLVRAEALDLQGRGHTLDGEALDFGYRSSALPEGWIVTAAVLQGARGVREDIARRMEDIRSLRADAQPLKTRTGGSTFKNPPDNKAWELIERAGCRGLRRGAAMVSEKHCNFLINTGGASAADIEDLGEEVRRRVLETTGVALEWEIRRIGLRKEGGT